MPNDHGSRLHMCDSLTAAARIGQVRKGVREATLVTLGDDLEEVRESLPAGCESYTAADVIERFLA